MVAYPFLPRCGVAEKLFQQQDTPPLSFLHLSTTFNNTSFRQGCTENHPLVAVAIADRRLDIFAAFFSVLHFLLLYLISDSAIFGSVSETALTTCWSSSHIPFVGGVRRIFDSDLFREQFPIPERPFLRPPRIIECMPQRFDACQHFR